MTDGKPIYAQINRKVWNTIRFRSLSPEARELFFYLTTCPHGNMLGIFVLRPGYALDDLQWGTNPKRFTKPLQELIDKQLFKYDFKNEVILDMEQIIKHPPENPNQVKWAIKIISSLPKTPLFQDVKLLCERLSKPFLKPFIERLGKPETITITETITETETETETGVPPADVIPFEEIVSYLNNKTGKKFDYRSKETQAKIKARWGTNGNRRSLEDFKRVIDNKCAQWLNDEKMISFLRPETLFGTKFESYLNEIIHPLSGKVSDKTIRNIETFNNWRPPQ